MKFIYHGLPVKNVDLVWAGIFKPSDIIVDGTIFEVPDENVALIDRVKVNGCFEEYKEPKKVIIPKKHKKEKKSKKNKEELDNE